MRVPPTVREQRSLRTAAGRANMHAGFQVAGRARVLPAEREPTPQHPAAGWGRQVRLPSAMGLGTALRLLPVSSALRSQHT